MPGASIDFINNNKAQGEVANHILDGGGLNVGLMKPFVYKNPKTGNVGIYATIYNGGDPKDKNSYQTIPVNNGRLNVNNTLRRDEWKQLDDAIVNVSRERLVAIQDLIDNNLIYNLGNAMGTTVLEWHTSNDPGEANVDMDAGTRNQDDKVTYEHNYTPIPIIHSDYSLNMRHLENSRRLGNPVSVDMAESASRRVSEKLENMLVTDTTFSFGATDSKSRNSIYSYVNHPDREQVSLAVNWDASAKTPTDIKDDVNSMIQAATDIDHHGPFMLYTPKNYESVLEDDYKTTSAGMNETIRQRLMRFEKINGVKTIDKLPDNNVVLVEMNTKTVRLVRGLGITNTMWEEQGGFVQKFKVFQIQVPQIRSDQNKKTGIIHLS